MDKLKQEQIEMSCIDPRDKTTATLCKHDEVLLNKINEIIDFLNKDSYWNSKVKKIEDIKN